MGRFTSPTDLEGVSDQDLRDSWLARGLLLRNLFTALQLRGRLATLLLTRARAGEGVHAPYAWMEVLHATWVLTENLLAAFELLADPDSFDLRLADRRKAAWSRLRDRDGRKRVKFVKKAWGYPLINTPALDDAYKARGLSVERGRAAAENLAKRSAAHLEKVLQRLQAFHQRYEDPCTAFKHGRAIYNLAITVVRGRAAGVINLGLKRDEDALTSFIRDESRVRVTELRLDDDLKGEVQETLETATDLVGRQAARCEQLVSLLEPFIALRGNPSETLGVITALFFFVDPETDDERELYRRVE